MKKFIKYIFVFALLLLSATILFACDTKEKLSSPINLKTDDVVLTWDKVDNASGYIVNIGSNEYSTNINNYSLADLEPGNYSLKIKAYGNETNFLNSDWSNTIQYTASQKLSTPVTRIFGYHLGWEPVANATGYRVSIDSKEYSAEPYSYSLSGLELGSYSLKVKALGDGIIYFDSDWSSAIQYNVKKLETPFLNITDNTLSWDPIPNVNYYLLKINEIELFGTINTTISLQNNFIGIIQIKAIGDGKTYFDSDWSNTITHYKKLATPIVNITDNTLKWDFIPYAVGYIVKIDEIEYNVEGYTLQYFLNDLSVGNHSLQVKALGNDEEFFINSDWSDEIQYTATQKLETLILNIANTTLTWGHIDNVKNYIVKIDKTDYILKGNINAYSLENLLIGNHILQVKAGGDGKFYFDSDWSSVEYDIEGYTRNLKYKLIDNDSSYEVTKDSTTTYSNVVIPAIYKGLPITSIGFDAFSDHLELISVMIPNSVTNIRQQAFYACKNLTIIAIPNSVVNIGELAFYACTSLTNISIPNSVTSIGNAAFRSCINLKSITIPDSVKNVGSNAFFDCISLTMYFRAPRRPDGTGWSIYWNNSNRPVIWYCALEHDEAGAFVVSFAKTADNIYISNPDAYKITAPYREGYSFGGWSFTNNGTTADYAAEDIESAINTTLYAIWIPNPI